MGGAIAKSGTFVMAERGIGSQRANRINAIEHTSSCLNGYHRNNNKTMLDLCKLGKHKQMSRGQKFVNLKF